MKRILPNLSDDKLVIQDFSHEVNLLLNLRHPNIVQFLGAVTEKKPLMLITEYLRGGDLHQHLKEKGALNPSTAINFALDIARGMTYLHSEPNVVIHRDLKPRNVLVNTSARHLKVGDFGLSKLIRVQHSHDVYKMTGEAGSYRYMAPEVFKHRKYDKKVDVYSFTMILYEMLEGEPPISYCEPYEAAKYMADGHRPMFKAKGFIPELRESRHTIPMLCMSLLDDGLSGVTQVNRAVLGSRHEQETNILGNFEETRKNQGNFTIRQHNPKPDEDDKSILNVRVPLFHLNPSPFTAKNCK